MRLTTAILAAHERASSREVDDVVAIGRQIAQVKRLLGHGEFLAWAREAVPLGERTIQRFVMLADFADRHPDDLRRLAHLGPAKLYRLAALPPGARRKLKLRTPIPIPGSHIPKTVEVMTTRELDRVIGGLATPPVPKTPIDEIVQSFRLRLAGLGTLAGELRARARQVDRGVVGELVAELYGLAEGLEATFEG